MIVKIKSEKRHNLKILIEKLEGITLVSKDNKISFQRFLYWELEWLFLSLIDFGVSLSIESKKRILSKTFRQLAIDKNYDQKHFLNLLTEFNKQHNRQKEKTYCMLTTLSIKNLPFRKIDIGKCKIQIHGKNFPKAFREHRNFYFNTHNFKLDNNHFTKLSVIIKSKDFIDAFEQANECLEVFRSLLCLFLNSQWEVRFGERSLKPINKIRNGEILTLHNEDGSYVNKEYYWFVPDYKEANLFELKNEESRILKSNIKKLVKWYNTCKLKHQVIIGKALNMYVGAFDENNKYISFLKAWTVLEILLNTDQNDLLIRRCTSMYNPEARLFQKQVLESLRQYRNETVHEGANALDPLYACFCLQKYIYNLIVKFNLRYSGFFNNIEEAILFLDNYSPELKEIQTRKKIIDRIIKLKGQKY